MLDGFTFPFRDHRSDMAALLVEVDVSYAEGNRERCAKLIQNIFDIMDSTHVERASHEVARFAPRA